MEAVTGRKVDGMAKRTIGETELRQWIDEWGEGSHDYILSGDDESDIANRILEHHTGGLYSDDVDWDEAWNALRDIIRPALEHVDGVFPDGAETLARYVHELSQGIDPGTGEEARRRDDEKSRRTSFRIRVIAHADPVEEPYLDKVIQAAEEDYRHDVLAGGDTARTDWLSAAAYEWRRLMLEPHAPTDPVTDPSALAIIAVGLRHAPDAVRAMMATDVLSPDLPDMRELRGIATTAEQDVPVGTLITNLIGRWPDAIPDRDSILDRDHAAWRILSPIHMNASAPVEGRIEGLLSVFDHVEYSGSTLGMGREHAERALRFDPSDRFASAALDAATGPNDITGLMEFSDHVADGRMER